METRPLFALMLAAIFLLVGFTYSYFNPLPNDFSQMPFVAVTIGLFLAGTVFFGYFAFIPALLFGLQLGAEKNAAIFLYIAPALLAIYAGTKLGFALQDDFNRKKNFLKQIKVILLLVIISIAIAVAIELALPTIIQLWPKDYLGLNVVKGNSALGLIGEIAKLARR